MEKNMFYELYNGDYSEECNGMKELKDKIVKDIKERYHITRLKVDPRDGDYDVDIELVIKDVKIKLEKKNESKTTN